MAYSICRRWRKYPLIQFVVRDPSKLCLTFQPVIFKLLLVGSGFRTRIGRKVALNEVTSFIRCESAREGCSAGGVRKKKMPTVSRFERGRVGYGWCQKEEKASVSRFERGRAVGGVKKKKSPPSRISNEGGLWVVSERRKSPPSHVSSEGELWLCHEPTYNDKILCGYLLSLFRMLMVVTDVLWWKTGSCDRKRAAVVEIVVEGGRRQSRT